MNEPGDEVTRAYRSLRGDEPPPAIDVAILAASRRAVQSRPQRTWGVPVSLAAVLVLGIGVALRLQMEEGHSGAPPMAPAKEDASKAATVPAQPAGVPSLPATPADAPLRAPEPARKEKARRATANEPAPAAETARAPMPASPVMKSIAPPPSAPPADMAPQAPVAAPAAAPAPTQNVAAPSSTPAAPPARRDATPFADALEPKSSDATSQAAPAREKREMRSAPAAGASALTRAASEPMAELERIAALREAGRDDEADRALEEFDRAHPGYRIPDAMQARVKRR